MESLPGYDAWKLATPPEYDEPSDEECGDEEPASPEWHFGVDADLLDTIEDGPAGPDCPCARCGAQFRPTVRP